MSAFADRVYAPLHRLLMAPGRQQNRFDRVVMRAFTRFDTFFFRHVGWSAAARLMGVDVLLLRTRGRRTGRFREVMVACLEVDGHLEIGGGNWGWDNDPGWFHNLRADREVEIVRARRTQRMRATVLDGDDAARASKAVHRAYPHSLAYVHRRSRPVSYVRLDPA
jgi:deazaflavin-dependent oxidoreductase (nitroreductase family)